MKEMIRGLLEDWIRISSVNPGEQPLESSPLFGEKQYTDRIKQMAEDAGYFCQYQKVTDGRYNLFIYAGNHEKGNPLLLLQTHSDVVAGKPELFRPKTEEGTIYGRGSCDAKGQLCAMLLGLKLARDELSRLPYGVCIALCCDEEFRHTGVDALERWERKEDVIAAFVGEPTEMKLAAACKGSIRFCIRTVGKQAHTSMTEMC